MVPMATYYFEARDRGGKLIRSTLEAPSIEEARRELRGRGYTVRKLEERKGALQQEIRLGAGKPGVKQVALFARQLAALIESGIDLSTALRILGEQTEHAGMREVIRKLHAEVVAGRPFAEALSSHGKVFPPIFVALVRAGERSGAYDVVLNRLAQFLERDLEIRGKVRSALTYPTIVLVAAVVITYGLITGMVPQFAKTLSDLGSELPALTRFLIWLSEAMKAYAPYAFGLLVVGALLLRYLRQNYPEVRHVTDMALLRAPLIGSLQRRTAVARFARTLSLLFRSGVPILEALKIARSVSGNSAVERAIDDAARAVEAGESLAGPLRVHGRIFPAMVVSMIAIGEESGRLEQMLDKIADYYEREVNEAVESLTAAIEPAMTLFLGAIVGLIVIGMFMPLFQLIQTLGGG